MFVLGYEGRAMADWPVNYGSIAQEGSISSGGVLLSGHGYDWQRYMTPQVVNAGRPYLGVTWVSLVPQTRGILSQTAGRVSIRCRNADVSFSGVSVLLGESGSNQGAGFHVLVNTRGDIGVSGPLRKGWEGVRLPAVLPPTEKGSVPTEVHISDVRLQGNPYKAISLVLINRAGTGRALWLPLHAPGLDYTGVIPSAYGGDNLQLWFDGKGPGVLRATVSVTSTATVLGTPRSGYWANCVARPAFLGDRIIVSDAFLGYNIGTQQLDAATYSLGTERFALALLLVIVLSAGLVVYRLYAKSRE